jgi:hypothetical protein
MFDRLYHAPDLRSILMHHNLMKSSYSQSSDGLLLLLDPPDGASDLSYLQLMAQLEKLPDKQFANLKPAGLSLCSKNKPADSQTLNPIPCTSSVAHA